MTCSVCSDTTGRALMQGGMCGGGGSVHRGPPGQPVGWSHSPGYTGRAALKARQTFPSSGLERQFASSVMIKAIWFCLKWMSKKTSVTPEYFLKIITRLGCPASKG